MEMKQLEAHDQLCIYGINLSCAQNYVCTYSMQQWRMKLKHYLHYIIIRTYVVGEIFCT